MPKNTIGVGPTDASQPGYFDLGTSEQSPNVTATPDHPSEAEYNDAMTRHGTDAYTDDDERVRQAYTADREAENAERDEEAAGEAAEDTEAERDYEDYSYPELQAAARERGVSAGGSAVELQERLREYDDEHADDEE